MTIHRAAKKGDLASFKAHLQRTAFINTANIFGQTPFLLAARGGHVMIIEEMLRNINFTESQLSSGDKKILDNGDLLHPAIMQDNMLVAEYALSKLKDPFETLNKLRLDAHIKASGKKEFINQLSLHLVVRLGDITNFKIVLSRCTDINILNSDQRSVFYEAGTHNQLDIVEEILLNNKTILSSEDKGLINSGELLKTALENGNRKLFRYNLSFVTDPIAKLKELKEYYVEGSSPKQYVTFLLQGREEATMSKEQLSKTSTALQPERDKQDTSFVDKVLQASDKKRVQEKH